MSATGFDARVRDSFARMRLMSTLGASLSRVAAGEVEIELPFRWDLTQQHGFVSAGVITAIADTACGYAAMTLMAEEATVVTVEYKVNFLAPARGERFLARGRAIKAGRRLTVCSGDVLARTGGDEKLVAVMLATMTPMRGHPETSAEADAGGS